MKGDWQPEITVYTDVSPDMRMVREDTFGRVLSVINFNDEDEAVRIANNSDCGLAADLWTRDISQVHWVASRLGAGHVYVNIWDSGIEKSFGGYEPSGLGREKGIEASHHCTQLKSITIRL